MNALVIRGQWGLGDNIYARPFIRAASARFDVFLDTPWPELYADLRIQFIRGERKLRTQMKNVMRQSADRWATPPKAAREIRLGYGGFDLKARGIVRTLENQLPLGGQPFVFDLPPLPHAPVSFASVKPKKPIALVRPVTVRREWRNEARNPEPIYVNRLADHLRKTHNVVAVADLAEGEEWLVGNMPPCDREFVHGELDVMKLLALTAAADIVLGGVGWIVPASLAAGVKVFIVYGGHGGHNAPAIITDPRIDCSRMGFAIPERFCQCQLMMHRCDKRISNLSAQWNVWAGQVGLSCLTN